MQYYFIVRVRVYLYARVSSCFRPTVIPLQDGAECMIWVQNQHRFRSKLQLMSIQAVQDNRIKARAGM